MKKLISLLTLILLAGCFMVKEARAFQVAAAPVAASPEEVAREFYRWYLQTLYKNKEPFKNKAIIAKYVTPRLIQELTRRMRGPDPIDYDYFLNAQDYGETWDKNIHTARVSNRNNTPVLNVSFGTNTSNPDHRVKVTLKQIKGVWKIDKVEARDDDPNGGY